LASAPAEARILALAQGPYFARSAEGRLAPMTLPHAVPGTPL